MNIHYLLPRSRSLAGLIALALLLVLSGCDAGGSGSETIVLSDPINPTEASVEFTYNADQLSGGEISVTSAEQDQLASVLSAYGYRRSDVVSARVEEVRLERLSAPSTVSKAMPQAKVFNYLSRVEVYFGSSTDAPLVGQREPIPQDAEVSLSLGPDRDVTSQVKSGATRSLLRLLISDPDQIGGGGDRVRVEIRFRIEVQQ